MDNLKKYLLEHREELDVETPDEAVLQRLLQQATPQHGKGKIRTIILSLAVAACIMGVIVIATRTNPQPGKPGQLAQETEHPAKKKIQPEITEQKKDMTVNDTVIQKERKEIPENITKKESPLRQANSGSENADDGSAIVHNLEKNYTQLVNLQLNTIRKTPVFVDGPDYFNDFKVQLHQMDSDEAALRKDIRVNGLNNILLEQLINIYQQKLNLLKNLLTEINKINNQVKQKSLPSDSLKTSFLKI